MADVLGEISVKAVAFIRERRERMRVLKQEVGVGMKMRDSIEEIFVDLARSG